MKLTVATSFPVHPPRGGGQRRIVGLYSALARLGVEVEVVALADRLARGGHSEPAPGVREVRVPKSVEHDEAEWDLQAAAGEPVTDVALSLLHDMTPEYGAAIAAAARGSGAVVASHPYAQPAIEAAGAGPLVYEAHNVEADLKRVILARAPDLMRAVESVERACHRGARVTLCCSREDSERLGELYGAGGEPIVVPNGTDAGELPFVPAGERATLKAALGLEDRTVAVFVGSWHGPNVEAAREVVAAAEAAPDVRFLVVGSVGLALGELAVPPNVDVCGVVEPGFIRSVLSLADAALNPMATGSGTNLKILDYALAGAPIVSTSFGVRGLAMEPGGHYLECAPGRLSEALAELRAEAPDDTARRSRAARDHVTANFTWDRIAARLLEAEPFRGLLEGVTA